MSNEEGTEEKNVLEEPHKQAISRTKVGKGIQYGE
jgi:hypothetical protein